MKRFLSILLVSIYLFFSLGLVITVHYCSGNLASLNLFKKSSCCCDEEKETTKSIAKDCCKDEIKTVKISDEQLQSKKSFQFYGDALVVTKTISLVPIFQFQQPNNTFFKSSIPRPPDDLYLIPIYKKVHSFIFYS